MKFSLFFEMQISDPTPATERQLFHDCVSQAVLADEVGFDGIWAVEHHGLREYAHSSAPEVFLGFVAARTRRIQLGHGVSLLPGKYNHPIRVAERLATLDILSQGRARCGTGKSGTRVEQGAFQIDPAELHAQWLEAVQMIPRMWREEVFEWKGQYYDIPPTQVVPKPWRPGGPPLYAACSKPELAIGAGELGLGALCLAMYRDEDLAMHVSRYREAIARARPVGAEVTNQFCCNPATLVLADDRKACRYGLAGSKFFLRSMVNYWATDQRPIGRLTAPRELPDDAEVDAFMRQRGASKSSLSSVVGSPAAARESVQRFQDAGVDELILVMQMGTQPHELIMESIRTMAEEVIPAFK